MPRTCPDCGWVWPNPRGACPNCLSDAAPELDLSDRDAGAGTTRQPARMPISLMILAVAFAIYLGWRLVQGIAWVVDRF